jgi:hypothetical protein
MGNLGRQARQFIGRFGFGHRCVGHAATDSIAGA